VDDLELLLDPATMAIAIRSAARLGKSDLGVNRRRVEALRKKLQEDGQSFKRLLFKLRPPDLDREQLLRHTDRTSDRRYICAEPFITVFRQVVVVQAEQRHYPFYLQYFMVS